MWIDYRLISMKLVYIDESAKENEVYLFGGLVVDEKQCSNISKRLDGLAKKVYNDYEEVWIDSSYGIMTSDSIEFHATKIAQGNDYWRAVDRSYRLEVVLPGILKILKSEGVHFFINGINIPLLKKKYAHPYPARDLALAHLLGSVQKQTEGKLLALADDHYTKKTCRLRIESIRHYAKPGYCRPGEVLTNYLDTVFFGDSLNSRLIQAADIVTYLYCRRWDKESNSFSKKENKAWYEELMSDLFAEACSITDSKVVFPYY